MMMAKLDLDSLRKSEKTINKDKSVTVRLTDEVFNWLETTFGKNKGEVVRRLIEASRHK